LRRITGLTLAAVIAATALRLLALSTHGTHDVEYWKTWSVHAATDGVTRVYGTGFPPGRHVISYDGTDSTVNYPPLGVAEFAAIGYAAKAVVGATFPNTPAFTRLIKVAILLSHLALAIAIFVAARVAGDDASGRRAAAMFWINPFMLLVSSLGYTDAFFAVPLVLSFAAATAGRAAASGVLLMAALMTKPQALLVAPAIVLMIPPARDRRSFTIAAAIAALIVVAPVVVAGTLPNMLRGLASNLTHDMLSGYACNVWWIVTFLAGGAHAGVLTEIVPISGFHALGPIDPRMVGTILTLAAWTWAFRATRRHREPAIACVLAAFCVHAYFVLSAQVHENHLFPAIPFLLIAAALRPRLQPLLWAVTAIAALNLYLFYGLGGEGVRPAVRLITGVDATVVLAAVNLAALAWHARVVAMLESTFAPVTIGASATPHLASGR
jgi:GPI-GlcNAc transferase complex PIG-U subunit